MFKQLTIISGKGGTGKTTVTAVFSVLASRKGVVIADGDVDAANLHILLKPEVIEELPFHGSKKAIIDPDICVSCGLCYELCRFDAVQKKENGDYYIDELKCEGCALCYNACPAEAIEMQITESGKIFVSNTKYGVMVHAMLNPGEESSGKLVSEVIKRAKKIAETKNAKVLLLDGSPGIGCPVIASLTGADLALVVTEPTLSGLRDMQRVLDLAEHFGISSMVAINKCDLNMDMTGKIRDFCSRKGIEVVGEIPYDPELPALISQLKIPFECEASEYIRAMWDTINEKLDI